MSNRDAVSHALDMIHTAHFRSLPREEQIDEVLGMLKVVDFKCPAVMYHGPGHQSGAPEEYNVVTLVARSQRLETEVSAAWQVLWSYVQERQALRGLHRRDDGQVVCAGCLWRWPCPTVSILEGVKDRDGREDKGSRGSHRR